jgi:tetratricopeptide (TPR) repeat protein
MAESSPPDGSVEPGSPEDLWQRVAANDITRDVAQHVWDRISRASIAAGNGPADMHTYEDFIATLLAIGRSGVVQERAAVMELLGGKPLAAERRYEALIDDAGTQRDELLWRMAALFAPIDVRIARRALERKLAREPAAAYARFTLGTQLQRIGDDTAAEAEYLTVVRLADDAPALQADALERLGYMAMGRGHHDEAIFNFERALHAHRRLDNRTGVLAILHELAEAAEQCGEIEKAERYLHQALELHEQLGAPVAIGLALSHLARLAAARGDPDAARPLIQRALPLLERQDVSVVAAYELADAGDVARECGDVETAEQAYQRTRVLSTAVGDDAGVARAFGGLGQLASEREDYDHAERLFRDASVLYERVGRQGMSARMLTALGAVHYDSGDTLGARQHWVRAVMRFDHLGRREEARQVRDLIGRIG